MYFMMVVLGDVAFATCMHCDMHNFVKFATTSFRFVAYVAPQVLDCCVGVGVGEIICVDIGIVLCVGIGIGIVLCVGIGIGIGIVLCVGIGGVICIGPAVSEAINVGVGKIINVDASSWSGGITLLCFCDNNTAHGIIIASIAIANIVIAIMR